MPEHDPLASTLPPPELPPQLGRYRVLTLLGAGGFGRVFLAHDDQLDRQVAVKVPNPDRVAQPEAYLAEARLVASLDHPHIVPVYDAGTCEHGCFVVSKFIAGADLAKQLQQARPAVVQAAAWVAAIAEALHHAHRHGLVHRDVKPGNILLDADGKPYLADFGLALKETDFGRGPGFAGTPAYMSPEQARGEGHRVDGRSDIFSLGEVFYELLTGRRPFDAGTLEEMLQQIIGVEARPPRQTDDTIPAELERICLKALAKRATERYTTARDFADDLRHFLAGCAAGPQFGGNTPRPAAVPQTTPPVAATQSGPLRIVPRGLRSFDGPDADFFLELLPGPRDRDGLPESLRFWKRRLEETDADNTFGVGLIYGPSGCGKSSLVKAGLLPRLADNVLPVYVEATAGDTETRLLHGLRKRCPALPGQANLKEALAELRRGQGPAAGRKVLLVLDQFEQWLHGRQEQPNTELVQALRQCDGGRVQCVLLVRDDFWMAVTRFLHELEVPLLEGQNSAAVDLFDADHARKVLAAFGRAFGKLPDNPDLTRGQQQFLQQAVSGLARDGKVVCVRLALFAEMMKGKPWTPATLKEVGGTQGIGVTFLEETFSAATAPPPHRYHQKAARAVLKALLPEAGSDLKGHLRSADDLLAAAGPQLRAGEFADVLRILDSEVRLLTPADPEGAERDSGPSAPARAGHKYYQLTHDYLVPALREWLSRKQKETRRGRAELRLAERTGLWQAKPEKRNLPSWWEWVGIGLLTRRRDWTAPQQKMMRQAAWYHGVRGTALLVLLLLLGWGVYEVRGSWRAQELVENIDTADTEDVPPLLPQLAGYRRWADPLLRRQLAATEENSRPHLHASLALLPADEGRAEYLYRRLLQATPKELPVIGAALLPQRQPLRERLWRVLADGQADPGQRFRAACALAGSETETDDRGRDRWEGVAHFVTDHLLADVGQNAGDYDPLRRTLHPVRDRLVGPLAEVFRSSTRSDADRDWAANCLAEYTADPAKLAELLLDANERQFAVLWRQAAAEREQTAALCGRVLSRPLGAEETEQAKERLARQQANAGVTLLRLGRPEKVWALLRHRPDADPRARSYLIHRLSPLGADPEPLVERLSQEKDDSIRRALLLSLGEFGTDRLPAARRAQLLPTVLGLYREEPDAGLHAAAEWLLRRWEQDRPLAELEQEWAKDERRRQERIERIRQQLPTAPRPGVGFWYVNGEGQTMVVVPGGVEFLMGSPPGEGGREGGPEGPIERRHKERIGPAFAIASKELTAEQFLHFRKDHDYNTFYAPTTAYPVQNVTWYDAAAYCNWLSDKEGLAEDQWCYQPNAEGKFAPGAKRKRNYLQLRGYRLPSEAEWEYACRAGTLTSRPYGETEELLGKYAWYARNSLAMNLLPGGRLKPNDLGLFDMLGNTAEWCQDPFVVETPGGGGKQGEDGGGPEAVEDRPGRVVRGGSFLTPSVDARSGQRNRFRPINRVAFLGFRVVRTFR